MTAQQNATIQSRRVRNGLYEVTSNVSDNVYHVERRQLPDDYATTSTSQMWYITDDEHNSIYDPVFTKADALSYIQEFEDDILYNSIEFP